LPAGAAAVLINQSHIFKDLVLILDAAEKHLFDGIDGSSCIGDIIRKISVSSLPIDASCRFFDRLWRWDQVVFDQSITAVDTQAGILNAMQQTESALEIRAIKTV
jgi:hypothetical protein